MTNHLQQVSDNYSQEVIDQNVNPAHDQATWSLLDDDFIPVIEHHEDAGSSESTYSAIYGDQPVAEFDVANWEDGKQVEITGAGRPSHWIEDLYPEDERQHHFQLGFKSVFRQLVQTKPQLEKLTANGHNPSMIEAIIKSGRPKGWERIFVTWGKVTDESKRDFHESSDPEDALNWLKSGGLVDVLYNRPLKVVNTE